MPGQDRQPRVGPRKSVAAGLPGVRHAMEYALAEMGPVRSAQALRRLNQADGFDCPSCAWPDPDAEHRHTAEFCENGAKAVAWEATRKKVDAAFFAAHSVAELRAGDDHWLEHHGRLVEPMYLAVGATHYRPIPWADALQLVADRLRALPDPNHAAFYTSGRASNEAAFVYQLLARRLGTNNLPDCSNMCHESSGTALTETIGIGKGTVSLADIADHAELIVIAGQNPGTNHPRMLSALETAKRRGARIVVVNPLPEAGFGRFKNPQTLRGTVGRGTSMVDTYLPVRVAGDLAFFCGVNKALLAREDAAPGSVLDAHFIQTSSDGFEAAAEHWRSLDWASIEAQSGLRRRHMEELASDIVRAGSVVVCWAMGLTQQREAVPTIREVVNTLLLRGNIGRPGAGPAPIRGHSNVQGDRTMGIWEKMPDGFLDALRDEFGFEPPRAHGYDTVDTIRAMHEGRIDVFVALGGNFVAATPDTALTSAAMSRVGLTVHVATKLNRSHVVPGREALILPCLGRSERDVKDGADQFVTVEDSMAMVHTSRGRLAPPSGDVRSEVDIVTSLGAALFGDSATRTGRPSERADRIRWSDLGRDYSLIRAHIAHVVPGFDDFERRVQQPGGFVLPRPPHDTRTFPTATGKARFTVNVSSGIDVPAGHLILQTVRSHDQFNTTVYGLDDRYRGIKGGRRVVFVNAADLQERGLRDGDLVDIVSVWSDGERRAPAFRVVEYDTAPGCAAAYFPEANVLVPLDSTAVGSNTPTSKCIIVRLERPPS